MTLWVSPNIFDRAKELYPNDEVIMDETLLPDIWLFRLTQPELDQIKASSELLAQETSRFFAVPAIRNRCNNTR